MKSMKKLGWGLFLVTLMAGPSVAQIETPEVDQSIEQARADGDTQGLFEIVRIELALFGGVMGGDAYLELPAIEDENITFDTGASDILDFTGTARPEVKAPLKYIQEGRVAGGTATFYMGKKFGFRLTGSWATAEAVLTGQSGPNTERFVADRSDMDILAGSFGIIYNPVKERKWKGVRPFVSLGFGGVLNKFPSVDDVAAVYFEWGGGVSVPLAAGIRAEGGVNWKLFSFDTDEVALDSTVIYPALTLGLAWRHDVPEDLTNVDAATPTDDTE